MLALGSKHASAFTWRLFKRFISLKFLRYKALEICDFFKVLYFFNSSLLEQKRLLTTC